MDTPSPRDTSQKNANPIEALSKDEIISKYKGLLNIAKKAKHAKDELTEENRQLKEALKRAAEKQNTLPAMQEMVQDFTDKNLILTEQVNSLKLRTKDDAERLSQFEIENESLRRQLGRLSDENDDLLGDVDRMEKAMQQVNALGNVQRKNLELLEVEIVSLKEAKAQNDNLRQELLEADKESKLRASELQELQEKYQHVKELNSEQRKKFNSLKDRFIEVHRKLKKLKECRCVLLETQHEYAASVSKWQEEIIRASQLLCDKMTSLHEENEKLKKDSESAGNGTPNSNSSNDLECLTDIVKQQKSGLDVESMLKKLNAVEQLAAMVRKQHKAEMEELSVLLRDQQQTEKEASSLNFSLFETKLEQMQSIAKRLEEERDSQQIKLQDLEAICIELRQHNEDLLTRYHLKEQEHTELLAEMRELNEALKGRGDVISRLQEQHDLEVKKYRELEVNLSECQQSLREKSQKIEQLQTKVEELEQANADAQSDVLSTSTISRAEELSRLRELDEGYEEKYHKLRALAAKLKKKLQEQTQQLNEMDKGAAMKEELEAIKLAQAQLQKDLNAARAENQRLKSKEKTKNTSVLNLEIEAAEKSLSEVSAKLTAKSNELETLKEALQGKESTIVQLRKEIGLLEQAKNGEASHSQQLKEQIDRMQVQVKDAVHGKQQALTQNKELEHSVEQSKLEAEQLRLQLADSAQQYESKLSKANELLDSRTQQLEAHLEQHKQLETNLKNAERAQEDLRVEYTEYKLKAQAVLRKNQNKGSNKEQELEDELIALRESERSLRASNDGRAARLTQLESQLEALQQDNADLQKRSRELLTLVDDLRQQNDTLTQENQRQLQYQHDLMQQHRQQMDQMDGGHQAQLKQIQQQLEESQQNHKKLSSNNNTAVAAAEPSLEQSKIDYLLMDHEAAIDGQSGEASLAQLAAQRKISTASRRSHDFMPLDELLNTSMNQITSDTVTTISHFGRSASMQEDEEAELAASGDFSAQVAQLQATKERLGIQESRVKHLTSLLAENEQDLAKLTQMNDMLKEELRRQERSEEREQHMHNSEYLKNVFLKFLTLNNADERQRLVPVLNTILRLSRNEMEMLNCVAKGQKVSNDGNNRSWTGFLTAWSGGGAQNGNSS
ncbi:GRIP and coiled-coil domain-containing protein 2 [Drosophila subobscura]|uniref:GRIP and coiled-coil domain-containing protein 2 n=1 Tax=Drosophila subobscura TaxID=7241 RepID=UPI00155A4670|nr:GRIP and coiled-coil domain-containing protein 2 [Drosophila subobscura]XP_034663657.1 GRIP and coiled-coil domain-containing protein 2 [Drosophila subobscura]